MNEAILGDQLIAVRTIIMSVYFSSNEFFGGFLQHVRRSEAWWNHRCKREGLETPGHVIAFVEARVDSGSFPYTSAVFAFFHHKTVCR